jgi:hypothetical protein
VTSVWIALDLGDRQVDLRHLGRGHTDNDVVVTVPDASVLFVGDLLENAPAPGFRDSYPIAWAETGLACSSWWTGWSCRATAIRLIVPSRTAR